MPTLISVDEFRERFDVDSDIDAKRIEPHIGSASRRLRRWVGETLYAQASAIADNEGTDLDLVTDLKNAEANLTFHFAIFGFNAPLSGKGVVATAMADEGREMRKYLTPDETARLSMQFLELAREIADPYITTEEDAGIDLIIEDEEDGEATTRY